MHFITKNMEAFAVKNINANQVRNIQNIQIQSCGKCKNICNSLVTITRVMKTAQRIHCCNTYATFTEKYLHISGSLLFFVLLLRLISNLLISDERSLGEKTESLN